MASPICPGLFIKFRQVCQGTYWKRSPILPSSWIALRQHFMNFTEHATVCIVVSIRKASGQRFVILPHLQQQKNRRFGQKMCSASLIRRICSVPFSFILVSDSVLEDVRNSRDCVQFVRTHDPDCFTYIEHGSKNRLGRLAQLHLENKCVPCYDVPENIPECLVFLLDYCLSKCKLPEFAFKEDILYC